MKACKLCNFITEESTCPQCGDETSKDWQGYVVIVDPNTSKLAQQMNIRMPGSYALRVR